MLRIKVNDDKSVTVEYVEDGIDRVLRVADSIYNKEPNTFFGGGEITKGVRPMEAVGWGEPSYEKAEAKEDAHENNVKKLERRFGDQFLGYTMQLEKIKGSIPKVFLLEWHWLDQVKAIVGDRKFYIRRASTERMVKVDNMGNPKSGETMDMVCVRIAFAE